LFTSDYLTVDPDLKPLRWSLRDPQRQTLWGHPAPKSWSADSSASTCANPRWRSRSWRAKFSLSRTLCRHPWLDPGSLFLIAASKTWMAGDMGEERRRPSDGYAHDE
jgi:hypothetical protein